MIKTNLHHTISESLFYFEEFTFSTGIKFKVHTAIVTEFGLCWDLNFGGLTSTYLCDFWIAEPVRALPFIQ